ncbi:MAG: hypothetical protein M5U28_00725 [Sandaracinaceae bacterium]|nr:hypothetical protein [Sandaracinaceae bacterium]
MAADFAVVQRRVTGACAAGQAIRQIAADGTVTCQPVPPAYTAGAGISITGTTIAVPTDGITSDMIADRSVSERDLNYESAGLISSTSDETVWTRYLGSIGGMTSARVQIAANGTTGRGHPPGGWHRHRGLRFYDAHVGARRPRWLQLDVHHAVVRDLSRHVLRGSDSRGGSDESGRSQRDPDALRSLIYPPRGCRILDEWRIAERAGPALAASDRVAGRCARLG